MNNIQKRGFNNEDIDIRRLLWILEMKKWSWENSELRQSFNSKRDKQILLLKDKGLSYSKICQKAKKYGCIWGMFE